MCEFQRQFYLHTAKLMKNVLSVLWSVIFRSCKCGAPDATRPTVDGSRMMSVVENKYSDVMVIASVLEQSVDVKQIVSLQVWW